MSRWKGLGRENHGNTRQWYEPMRWNGVWDRGTVCSVREKQTAVLHVHDYELAGHWSWPIASGWQGAMHTRIGVMVIACCTRRLWQCGMPRSKDSSGC